MLRWCHFILRYRGTKNASTPYPSLGTRYISYPIKLDLREVESTYAADLNVSAVSPRLLVHSRSVFPANPDLVDISTAGLDESDCGGSVAHASLEGGTGEPVQSETERLQPQLSLPNSEPRSTAVADVMERPPVYRGARPESLGDLMHPTLIADTASSGDLSVDPGTALTLSPSTGSFIAADAVRSLLNGCLEKSHRCLDIAAVASLFNNSGPGLLHELGENQSSELLCLFGSVSDGLNMHKYHSRNRKWIRDASGGKSYWEAVLRIVKEKEIMGHEFGERDNFWSMRAYLEQVKGTGSMDAMKMAGLYYSRIIRQSHDPFIHIVYFDTLLSYHHDSVSLEVVDALNDNIEKQNDPPRSLVILLWKVILLKGNTLPPTCKAQILSSIRHRPPPRLSAYRSHCTSIHDLVIAFAAALFPCYRHPGLPATVSSWATACAHASIVDGPSVDERFGNLALLAMYHLPRALPSSPTLELTAHSLEWRVVIGTAILYTSLGNQVKVCPERSEIQNLVRSFWRLWKDSRYISRPRDVDRAVVTAFVRIATKLRDEPLLSGCANYTSSRQLWQMSPKTQADSRQVEQLFAAFADGLPISQAPFRDQLLFVLREPLLRSHYCIQHLGDIFRRLIADDVDHAYQLYLGCRFHNIRVPPAAAIPMAQSLAFQEKWDNVIPFFTNSEFSDVQLEQLLETVLSVFQATRQEFTNPVLAKAVGDLMQKLYSRLYMPDRLNASARFFLPIMIASHRPREAVQLLKILLRNDTTALTPRFFTRIIRTLMSHRQHVLAVEVLELASASLRSNTLAVHSICRKTLCGLIQGGALRLARRVDSTITRFSLRTFRDRLLRANTRSSPTKLAALRLVPAVMAHPTRGSTIIAVVQLLVKSGHLSMARRVIEQSHRHFKPDDLTALGNIYLHGPLFHRRLRNKRLMRYILRTKDLLIRQYGFKPDRTTLNIVVKAMLTWRVSINLQKIKSLFDHLIRHGYPASERWRTSYGVPFGSPVEHGILDLSDIRQNMSFKRHVRPLYKMFIKEFFLRKDKRAAHRVVGILKEEEVLALQRKEERERIRRLGIVKKQRRRALERIQTK